MKKEEVVSGLLCVFAAAAIGAITVDAGGYFGMQRFDLTVAHIHDANARGMTRWPSVEDSNGRIYPVTGGGAYSTPDGWTWDDTTSLLGKIEEGKTYCAVRGEPVVMRQHGAGNLIGIYASGPCPK